MMQQTIENKGHNDTGVLGAAAELIAYAHVNTKSTCVCGAEPKLLLNIVVKTEPPQLLAIGLCSDCLGRPFREIMKTVSEMVAAANKNQRVSKSWEPML